MPGQSSSVAHSFEGTPSHQDEGASSPHPYTEFGCTTCHGGLDRATDFARAGHSPTSEDQREEWIDEYGWEPQKYLDNPILPAGQAEDYWQRLVNFDVFVEEGTISPRDVDLIQYAETAQEVWNIIAEFYQHHPQPKLPRGQ